MSTNAPDWRAELEARNEAKVAEVKRRSDEYEALPEVIEYRRESREQVRPMTLTDAGTHPDEIGHAKLAIMHGFNSSTLQLNLNEWAVLRDKITEYLGDKNPE